MAIVFQYGSNTLMERLNSKDRLDCDAVPLGLAFTEGKFDLDFTYYSKTNGCASADLRTNGTKQIYGVLYKIPNNRLFRSKDKSVKTLDEIEGEGSAYRRIRIRVVPTMVKQAPCEAWTYVVINPQQGLKTCIQYVRHIIKGLRDHYAPDDYIDYVKERARENNSDIADELEEL